MAHAEHAIAGSIPDANIVALIKEVARHEKKIQQLERSVSMRDETIRILREKLSLSSPTAEQQFNRLAVMAEARTAIDAAQWESIRKLEERVAALEAAR